MMKLKIMGCLLMAATATGVWAQGGTKSPYSQFGVGVLSDASQSMNRGMNGVGYGLRQGNQVNTLNPASYSSIDSLTMLFDMGMSGQFTQFKEGGAKRNASMASFEYVVGSFRAWKNVGVSFGVLPYSSVGYDYQSVSRDAVTGTLTESYTGSGGLHQVFLGVGWRLLKPLSVGVNAGYLWGSIDRTVAPSSSVASNTLTKTYNTTINNYKVDFGVQWEQPLGKHDLLTVGAVLGLGHNLNNDASMQVVKTNSLSSANDTTQTTIGKAMSLPMSFGVGMSYQRNKRLTLAADFLLEQWGKEKFPSYVNGSYELQSGILKDRVKVNAGLDWVPNPESRKLAGHIHYRFGAGYATPYYIINGVDGPKDLTVSAGVALPIVNNYNNRSVLNISAQWAHSSAQNLITENTFRINIGITFNERWFMKWKVD
ncbi:MAG: hypothetical protein IJ551_02455 [Prevotella sp.]|nr:hypothetical protein [Prevotella sp.]